MPGRYPSIPVVQSSCSSLLPAAQTAPSSSLKTWKKSNPAPENAAWKRQRPLRC